MAFFDIGSKFEFVVGTTQQMSYSAVRMKPDKKYLNFFWVFPQITRVMRSLSIKNNCRNASRMKKLQFFKF